MPGRLLLALVIAVAVALSAAPAEVQAWDDPVSDVGDAVLLPEDVTIAQVTTCVRVDHAVLELRPRDAGPPPVPPPER